MESVMLGVIARVLIGTVLGTAFLIGMAFAYASDLLTPPPENLTRKARRS